MTDVLVSSPWICRVLGEIVDVLPLRHYRLVMGTVGQPLKLFRGAKELLYSTYDVFTGEPVYGACRL